jgi:PST family polysaccharide transporter
LINKILAQLVGPSGYALIGQFQNGLTALSAFASAGVGTGVTKYTAEFAEQSLRQKLVWSTAAIAGFLGSVVMALALAIFHKSISIVLLKDPQYASTILWAAACLPLIVLNILLLAILNGKKAVKRLVLANIGASVATLITVGIGAWLLGLHGALIALAVGQSISTAVTLWLCLKTEWFRLADLWLGFDMPIAKKLANFTLMAAATSVIGPLSQVMARNSIIEQFGVVAAGQWEAVTRISGIYLMFITMTLSVYYLPRLAELHDKHALRSEILNCYKLILPIAVSSALLIYFFRDILILSLFTIEFTPMRDLFMWQLIGDVFRVATWLLSFYLLSKALTKHFILLEVTFSLTFVGLVILANRYIGIEGATFAFALNSFCALLIYAYFVNKNLNE